jgi:ankyrin repeat protein/predicted DNA-binding WGR domain protein
MQRDRELYKAQDLVAVLDENDGEYMFSVYRLHEAVRASFAGNKTVEASIFDRDAENPNQYYSTENESQIEVSSILRRVLRIREGVHDEDGVERNFIVVSNRHTLALMQAAKHALESASEEEGGEEEHEALGKRALLKKSQQKPEEDSEEQSFVAPSNDGEDMEPADTPTKKNKKVKAHKPKSEKQPKEPKEPKAPKAPKEPKAPRVPKQKKVVEYKRGKFNIKITEDPIDRASESTSSTFNYECCDVCSNRECIRAVNTSNKELFKNILNNRNKLTSLFMNWGTDDPITCLELAIKKNDEEMVDLILQEIKKKDASQLLNMTSYKLPDAFGIAEIGTGFNDKYAYGVATRKVALGRGNREGVNALCSDDSGDKNEDAISSVADCSDGPMKYSNGDEVHIGQQIWETIMTHCSVNVFKKIISTMGWTFENWFSIAVRACNRPLAAYIAEKMIRSDGYGLNDLHLKALTAETVASLGVIRSVSVKKKSMGTALILPIFCAAMNPNYEVFVKMYESLDDRFVRDEKSSSTIFYAAMNENPKILEYMLNNNVEFREANKLKMTALMWAAKTGREKNVELLLKKGDISKKKSRDGYAAIHYAALNNHIAVIKVMAENGADINLPGKDRMTPLAIAASRGHYDTVKFLLEKGAKTIKKDKYKRSPLILALKNCHAKIASLLITHGCPVDEPDSSDNFPIHYACAYGCYDAIDFLIRAGASPNVYNSWKLTPIAAAMMKNHFGIINKLLDYPDIDVNCKDDNGRTLVSNSVRNLNEKAVNFVEMIIKKHKADIEIPDLKQRTPLHHMMIIHSGSIYPILKQNAGMLRNPNAIKVEYQAKITLFIRLLNLLSHESLKIFNKADDSNQHPLEYFASGLRTLLSFNFLSVLPQTSTYNYSKGAYDSKWEDFHSFLEGGKVYDQLNNQFIKETFLAMLKIYNNVKNTEPSRIQDELTEVKPEVATSTGVADRIQQAQNLPSYQAFSLLNESVLPVYMTAFQSYHFLNPLRRYTDMQKNEKTELTRMEINNAIDMLNKQKESFLETVRILVDELNLSVQGRNSDPSAKAVVLKFISTRWYNLFLVPDTKSSTINLVNKPTTNTSSGGMFNNSGFSFGQVNNSRNQQQQNSNQYIDLQSTGVNENIYEQMKQFRNYQIKERENLTLALLELISSKHESTLGENWIDQHNLGKSMISMIPDTFFVSSVNSLSLASTEDSTYVKQSCRDMIKSNAFLGKKLISLAQLGIGEFKAQIIGSQNSLLDDLASTLPSVWSNLSVYVDISGKGNNIDILLEEFYSRLDFIEWVIGQFTLTSSDQQNTKKAMKEELDKVNKTEKHLDKLNLIISRRKYQRSLLEAFYKICTNVYSNFIGWVSTHQNWKDVPIDKKKTVASRCCDLLAKVGGEVIGRIDDAYLGFVKQSIAGSLVALVGRTFAGLTYISVALSAVANLKERQNQQSTISQYTADLIEQRITLRDSLFAMVKALLIRAKLHLPVNVEETASDFSYSDKLTTGSSSETSLLNSLLQAVVVTSPVQNISTLSKLLELPSTLGLGTQSAALQTKLNTFKLKEISFYQGLLNAVVDNAVFADHKLDQFTLSVCLNCLSAHAANIFYLEPSIIETGSNCEKEYIEARIRTADMVSTLTAQLFKCYDPKKPLPDTVKSKLVTVVFDQDRNSEVTMVKDLEEWLESTNTFPLFVLIKNLTLSSMSDPFLLLKLDGKKGFHHSSVEEIERARTHLLGTLLQEAISLFDLNKKDLKDAPIEILFNWPKIIQNMLCPLDHPKVVGLHEIPEKNNDKQYLQFVNKIDSLREKFILTISDIFINHFETKKTNYNDELVLEGIFQVYIQMGWTNAARRIIIGVLDRLFMKGGNIGLDIPKIRHPLFYLAEHPNFAPISWRNNLRVDFQFFEFVLGKCPHPNLVRIVEPNPNQVITISLFSAGFSAENGNFLRALLAHPLFKSDELFEEKFKGRLHRLPYFVTCEQDERFVHEFVNLIKQDELMMEFRKDGFTPLLRLMWIIQTERRTTSLGSYLYQHPQASPRLLKILIDAGASKSAVYTDPEAIKKQKEDGTVHPFKDLEGQNLLHLSMLGTPSTLVFDYLLSSKVPVDTQDDLGNTPLHIATKRHQNIPHLINALLQHKANLNLVNAEQESPIFALVRSNNLEMIEVLRKAGANFDLVNVRERSPLVIFIEEKNIPGIEFLLKLGASSSFRDNFHRNALHWAINFADHTANSSFEIEDILIRNGVEINTADLLGRTPLHYPFVKVDDFTITHCVDPIESVNSLLSKKNLKIDERDVFGNTPLIYAAQRGSLVSALYLLDKNADLRVTNLEGNNPFATAMASLHDHLAITLLNKGVEWNTFVTIYTKQKREKVYNRVLAKIKTDPSFTKSADRVHRFITEELESFDEEEEKKTPGFNKVIKMHGFRWAIRNNWQGLAYMILSKGYDIGEAVYATIQEKKFNYTFTLLTKSEDDQAYRFVGDQGDNIAHLTCYAAAEVKKDLLEKIFRVLVKKGISLYTKNAKGHTSLHCAAVCGSTEMINLLLESNISPDETDVEGCTPLMLAAQNGNFEAVMRLFGNTKNMKIVDKDGRNILHHLCRFIKSTDAKLLAALQKVCRSVDCNLHDNIGKTPLHYLLKSSNVVKSTVFLIEQIRDIDTRDAKGQSIIMVALKNSPDEAVLDKIILDRRPKPNGRDQVGRTALSNLLYLSSVSNARKIQIISQMVDTLKADINEVASYKVGSEPKTNKPIYMNMSGLDFLLRTHSSPEDLISHLLKLGARLDLPNDAHEKSLEIIIKHRSNHNLLSILIDPEVTTQNICCDFQITVNYGPYKDKTISGMCYLMTKNIATSNLQTLVKRGNDISKTDANGISPLMFAVSEQKFEYVKPLLVGQTEARRQLILNIAVPKRGLLFDSNPRLVTPLSYAIKYNKFEEVKLLLLNGAGMNYAGKGCKPPAYYLVKYCYNKKGFENFLMRFMTDKKFAELAASSQPIVPAHLNFTITEKWKVNEEKEDSMQVSPLYYALSHGIPKNNLEVLLNNYPAMNFVGRDGNTAFSLALTSNILHANLLLKSACYETDYFLLRKSAATREDPRSEVEKKLPLNEPFTVFTKVGKETKSETFLPLNYYYSKRVTTNKIMRAIRQGADFNIQEAPTNNNNLIMLAILENDQDLIESIEELVKRRGCVAFDATKVDVYGRTPIHLVVKSHKNGSYENVALLKLLSRYYDINKADNNGFPPIYYAAQQDSGVMLEALTTLGAREFNIPFGTRRAPTSLIAFATFPDFVPDYDTDADIFLKSQESEQRQKMLTEKESVPLDTCIPSNIKNTSRVMQDETLDNTPFDIYMTKVDIKKGQFGGNVFYRMQLLHETNRDVYIVFTRYGRIGDSGQHQLTSFSKREEALNEFKTIFKQKSGNDWSHVNQFTRHKKKYKLVKFNQQAEKEHLTDFYQEYHDKDLPRSQLNDTVKNFIKQVVSAKVLFAKVKDLKVDIGRLPLSRINKPELLQAMTLLHEMKKVAKELKEERQVDVMESEPEKIFDLLDELAEMTSDYYELVPTTKYRQSSIPPLESIADIDQNIMLVRELLDVEVAVKILLGAKLNIKKMNPLDYSYDSLNIKLVELEDMSIEKTAILEYISKTMDYGLQSSVNAFALERRGETERFEKHMKEKNRKLLWHGSKTMNFIGILNKGLKIAPPEAPITGHMFGKGIYFSDSFAKSFNYADPPLRIILLCEVALGNSQQLYQATQITTLQEGYQSVLGVGQHTPDPRKDVVIPNGMVIPLGDQVLRPNADKKLTLAYNEYVVYNEDQVKIRYMVCMNR